MLDIGKLRTLVVAAAVAGAIYYDRRMANKNSSSPEPEVSEFASLPEVKELMEYATSHPSIYVLKPNLSTLPNAGMHTWLNNTTVIAQCNAHPVTNLLGLQPKGISISSVNKLTDRWRHSNLWTQFCDFIGYLNQSTWGSVLSAAIIGGVSAGLAWGLSSLVSLFTGFALLGPIGLLAIGIFSALVFWTYSAAKKAQARKASNIVCELTKEVLGLSIMFNTYDTFINKANDLVFKPNAKVYSKDTLRDLERRLDLASTCVHELEIMQNWLRHISDADASDIIDNRSKLHDELRSSSLRLIKYYLAELHYSNGLRGRDDREEPKELDYTLLLANYNTNTLRLPYLFSDQKGNDWYELVKQHPGVWLTAVPFGASRCVLHTEGTLYLSYGQSSKYKIISECKDGQVTDITTTSSGDWDITTTTSVDLTTVVAKAKPESALETRFTLGRLQPGAHKLLQRDMYFNPILFPIYLETEAKPEIVTTKDWGDAEAELDLFKFMMPLGSNDETDLVGILPAIINTSSIQKLQAARFSLKVGEPLDPLILSALHQAAYKSGGVQRGLGTLFQLFKPSGHFKIDGFYKPKNLRANLSWQEIKTVGILCMLDETRLPKGYEIGFHKWRYNLISNQSLYGAGLPYLITVTAISEGGYHTYYGNLEDKYVTYDLINLVTRSSMTLPAEGVLKDLDLSSEGMRPFHYIAASSFGYRSRTHIGKEFFSGKLQPGNELIEPGDYNREILYESLTLVE